MSYLDRKETLNNVFKPDVLKFRIGELSKMTGVSTRQLRYWESKGIVNSLQREGTHDARIYDYETFHRVKAIKYFLDEGYTLKRATEKTNNLLEVMKTTYAIMSHAVSGISEIDGQTMLDLGEFNQQDGSHLWASIDDQEQVHYHVRSEDR
ncbi:hypothetical protein JOC36_000497 [Weissella uvarum]|uniref:MerR family transcriptional regulator n=1 Tax=Weissella uvarum TaxID=1479233 RepID=UPI001960930E|nr:MerR family transcriptional regulator [Weissella uvarum]MBM7616964.1 hypothetical protein [Weissella uvarum]MCM0594587.1 MerR family transcriptional regulator [Weissella uvarum]